MWGTVASQTGLQFDFLTWNKLASRKDDKSGACLCSYCLVGLVVRRPPREWKIPGSNPACARIFSGSSHTSDSKIGTPVATLPGAWRYRVSTGTGQPGVSILWLGEVERLICNFYLGVAAGKIVWDTQACCWDVKPPANKQTNLSLQGRLSQIFWMTV